MDDWKLKARVVVIVQDEMSFCWIIMIILSAGAVNYQKNILIPKKEGATCYS